MVIGMVTTYSKLKERFIDSFGAISTLYEYMHCRMINEGNASVMITAVEPGSEQLYLYS